MKAECCKFSGDVKFFAEYQTSIRHFYPWLSSAGLYIFILTFILKQKLTFIFKHKTILIFKYVKRKKHRLNIEIFLYISELKVSKGLSSPTSLLAACNQLGECKSFEVKDKILLLLLTFQLLHTPGTNFSEFERSLNNLTPAHRIDSALCR